MNATPLLDGDLTPAQLRPLLRDLTAALAQQMYFWGRDVIHPEGNLLHLHGFERLPSEGLKGTSRYRKPLEDGSLIELHGACVGHYPDPSLALPGFLFVRARHQLFLFDGPEPPVPGEYPAPLLRTGPARELHAATCRFLDWWLSYESWILGRLGTGYRTACYRTFTKLPASSPWLPPTQAQTWLQSFRESPSRVGRARQKRVASPQRAAIRPTSLKEP